MTNVLRFPLERVRLRNTDAQWADAICEVVTGKGLTSAQVLAFVKWIDAYRFDHPHAYPSAALVWDLWDNFENEHLIRGTA